MIWLRAKTQTVCHVRHHPPLQLWNASRLHISLLLPPGQSGTLCMCTPVCVCVSALTCVSVLPSWCDGDIRQRCNGSLERERDWGNQLQCTSKVRKDLLHSIVLTLFYCFARSLFFFRFLLTPLKPERASCSFVALHCRCFTGMRSFS